MTIELLTDEQLQRIKKGLCADCDGRAVPGLFRCAEHHGKQVRRRMPGRCAVCGEPAGRNTKCEQHRRGMDE